MNDEVWRVKDVMNYFGEWIEGEDAALTIMRKVKEVTPGFYKLRLSRRMDLVRDYLKYVLKQDVRFMSGYRRIKEDD